MIRLTVDGKDFSCQNIDVLINYDYIRNKTEVKLFNGVENSPLMISAPILISV